MELMNASHLFHDPSVDGSVCLLMAINLSPRVLLAQFMFLFLRLEKIARKLMLKYLVLYRLYGTYLSCFFIVF